MEEGDAAAGDGAPTCSPAEGTEEDDAAARSAVRLRLLEAAPDTVRAKVAELVAVAVGNLPVTELPPPVRPVARFAPAKRARAGAGPLLGALGSAQGFATLVVDWWTEERPADWRPPAPDPVHAAAVAVLEGREEGSGLVRDLGERADAGRARAKRDAALAKAERLEAEVRRLTAERDRARAAVDAAAEANQDEIAKLRARLREQGTRVRRAEDEAAELRAAREAGDGGLRAELEELRRDRDRQRELAAAADDRARRAADDLAHARRASVEARRADDARLALLVDTVAGAAEGLRQELGLRVGDTGSRPAELVGAGSGTTPKARVTDPAALDRLLALPEVHLMVDGYNVTKTGWPELSLAAQRERLVAALAPLTARTGAETTLVFDGAGITGVPTHSVRGVRVLFSEPGVIADDLIRSLVGAEPEGRPLVVVTSDRAVVDSVRRQGAHPVPSSVLLARLSRI
ncbi:putative RNA-binding protein with PIN domain [Actinomycetospora succinea]|uniref:Putative RNA-binding protein with PIN domain n=1 Tax=Actinomycetospora succinea TaxID=663603 RepID=A0A4R6V5S4_9PSEU|nr:NYN domain-containing protein [Actinomycetospora succinea]TDQ55724.1 putative RNA-binding protein with PIN domain [Actinomycetospora succinea]